VKNTTNYNKNSLFSEEAREYLGNPEEGDSKRGLKRSWRPEEDTAKSAEGKGKIKSYIHSIFT